jgi:hypothetical protein
MLMLIILSKELLSSFLKCKYLTLTQSFYVSDFAMSIYPPNNFCQTKIKADPDIGGPGVSAWSD